MLQAIELANALRAVFTSGIEFQPDCFVLLSGAKLKAYLRKCGPMIEPMYEVVSLEPTVIKRTGNGNITLELSIVSERDRQHLLNAVKFVHTASREMKSDKTPIQFADRLDWLRPRLPEIITGELPA
jgi:hypothetical protein